jgi:hypothetical protein
VNQVQCSADRGWLDWARARRTTEFASACFEYINSTVAATLVYSQMMTQKQVASWVQQFSENGLAPKSERRSKLMNHRELPSKAG